MLSFSEGPSLSNIYAFVQRTLEIVNFSPRSEQVFKIRLYFKSIHIEFYAKI